MVLRNAKPQVKADTYNIKTVAYSSPKIWSANYRKPKGVHDCLRLGASLVLANLSVTQ